MSGFRKPPCLLCVGSRPLISWFSCPKADRQKYHVMSSISGFQKSRFSGFQPLPHRENSDRIPCRIWKSLTLPHRGTHSLTPRDGMTDPIRLHRRLRLGPTFGPLGYPGVLRLAQISAPYSLPNSCDARVQFG